MALRRACWSAGLRYRVHYKLPGRPDIAFPRAKLAVFVDGCFWHGCPAHGVSPKNNARFWRDKIRGNVERDARVTKELEALGWRVLRLWEHEITDNTENALAHVKSALCRCFES